MSSSVARHLNRGRKKSMRCFQALSASFSLMALGLACAAEAPPDPPQITGGITLIGQKVKSSDPAQIKKGDFGSSLSVDLNFEKKVGDGKVTVWLMHAEGFNPVEAPINTDYEGASGTPGTPSYEEGFSDTRIAEAKYELPMTDNLTMTFGKVSPQGYFDSNNAANDQTRQFLAGPLVNNPAIDFPGHMATHAYPGGVIANFVMNDTVTLQAGLLEDAEDYSGKFQKTFTIVEGDAKMELLDGETNVRLIYFSSQMNKV